MTRAPTPHACRKAPPTKDRDRSSRTCGHHIAPAFGAARAMGQVARRECQGRILAGLRRRCRIVARELARVRRCHARHSGPMGRCRRDDEAHRLTATARSAVGAKVCPKVSASHPNIPPAPRENSGGSRSAMPPPPEIKSAKLADLPRR